MPVSKRKKTVNVADIESVVARIARIPEKSVSQSDRDTLKNLGDRLKCWSSARIKPLRR